MLDAAASWHGNNMRLQYDVYKNVMYMFSKGYCEKSTQTDVSQKKFHSELLVSHELKPCFKHEGGRILPGLILVLSNLRPLLDSFQHTPQ